MTTLPSGPAIGEQQLSTHDCVPASLAWVLQRVSWWFLANRRAVPTVQNIHDWLTAQGFDTSSGVTINHVALFCKAQGIPFAGDDGLTPMQTYVDAALSNQFYTLGFHQCDGGANPIPVGTLSNGVSIEHCRAFFGDDGGAYDTMNPWPPSLDVTPFKTMLAADTRQHLTILIPATKEETMLLIATPTAGIWLLSGSLYAHVDDIPDFNDFANAGLKTVQVSDAMHQTLLAASHALSVSGSIGVSGTLVASNA